jgi:polysaccharide export outer membrane protein
MPVKNPTVRLCRGRTRRHVMIAGLLLPVFGLAGCNPGGDLPPIPPYDPSVYRLGVDDQLRIVTYGEDQLSGDFRVNESGNIALPLIGDVAAAHASTTELARRIEQILRAKEILSKPSVSVEISAYRSISVLGEVVKPGQYPYQPGMTMLTAVAAAGGFTYRAVQAQAYVARKEGNSRIVGKLEPDDYVEPGDVVKIYERYF